MKFDLRNLHPSIKRSLDEFESRVTWSMSMGSPIASKVRDAYAEQQRLFWKRVTGPATLLVTASIFGAVAVGVYAHQFGKPYSGLAVIGSIIFDLALWWIAYKRSSRNPTELEFEAIVPGLELDEVQMQYVIGYRSVQKCDLSDEFKTDLLAQMHTLLDDHERLKKQRILVSSLRTEDRDSQIKTEVQRIEAKLESTQDERAREILRESLEVARLRGINKGDPGAVIERIDAQMELIRQTMGRLNDGIGALSLAPNRSEGTIDGLRERIGSVRAQTDAIDAAVQELSL